MGRSEPNICACFGTSVDQATVDSFCAKCKHDTERGARVRVCVEPVATHGVVMMACTAGAHVGDCLHYLHVLNSLGEYLSRAHARMHADKCLSTTGLHSADN